MALANPLSRKPARPPRPSNRSDYFADSVHGAVERIARQCPDALVGVTFGIEDVSKQIRNLVCRAGRCWNAGSDAPSPWRSQLTTRTS